MHINRKGIESFELAFCLSMLIIFIIAILTPKETKNNVNISASVEIETKKGNEKMIKKTDARYIAVLCIVATKLTEKEWDDLFFFNLDDNSGGYQFKLGDKFINLYYDENRDDLFVKHSEDIYMSSKTDRYELTAEYIVKYLKEN